MASHTHRRPDCAHVDTCSDNDSGVGRELPHDRTEPDDASDSLLETIERLAGLDMSKVDAKGALAAAVDCENVIAYLHSMQARVLTQLHQRRLGAEEFVADKVARGDHCGD